MAKMQSKGMLKKGLKQSMPAAPSAKAKGANINSGANRTNVPNVKTLGPRTA